MAKAAAAPKKAVTKTQILSNIAEQTELTKKQVAAVFEALAEEIKKNITGRGPGVFVIPGLVKIQKKKVPAKAAQKGVKNPFTGEIRDVPAKPATNKIRVLALKNLKDMIKS